MKIAITCLSFACFVFTTPPLFAETPQAPRIERITFHGLRKTKESYLRRVLNKYIGMAEDELDIHSIETDLQKEGLFSSINIALEHEDGSSIIDIDLKEKISFLPIPFAMVTNNSIGGGGFILDMNAFGVKDTFVAGGFIAKNSQLAGLLFSQPAIDLSHPGFSALSFFSRGTADITTVANDKVFSYDYLGFDVSLSLEEKVNEYISLSAGTYYAYHKLDDDYGLMDSYHSGNVNTGISFHTSNWNGWFLSGISASIQTKLAYNTLKNRSEKLSCKLDIQQPIIPRLRLLATASAFYGHKLELLEYEGRGAAGVLILPQDFRSDRLFGASAGSEAAIVPMKFGLLSLYGLYEFAVVDDWAKDAVFEHGPRAGIKMYLSQIAIPALDVSFAYNIPERLPLFSFSLGMSF